MFDISYDKTCARAVAINLPWQVWHGSQTLALLVSDWTVLSAKRRILKHYENPSHQSAPVDLLRVLF
jgi:hypothetical protein